MSYFKWNQDEYSVKVNAMDDEHKTLINKMNALYDKNTQNAKHSELKDLMNDFANYCVKHFNDEEEYMARIEFPDLETHKIIHQTLLEQFTKHKEKFEAAEAGISSEFFAFLKLWLQSHICGVDMKYGKFSVEHNKAS